MSLQIGKPYAPFSVLRQFFPTLPIIWAQAAAEPLWLNPRWWAFKINKRMSSTPTLEQYLSTDPNFDPPYFLVDNTFKCFALVCSTIVLVCISALFVYCILNTLLSLPGVQLSTLVHLHRILVLCHVLPLLPLSTLHSFLKVCSAVVYPCASPSHSSSLSWSASSPLVYSALSSLTVCSAVVYPCAPPSHSSSLSWSVSYLLVYSALFSHCLLYSCLLFTLLSSLLCSCLPLCISIAF